MFVFFCFFKQKTAYEMRISDWSSDVCSSDLGRRVGGTTSVSHRPLVATSRRIDEDIDLLQLAGADGLLLERSRSGLAGRGVAARVDRADAAAVLASMEVDDEVDVPGSGAVAFGALPFVGSRAAELVLPAAVWGRAADGTRWLTTIAPGGSPEPDITRLPAGSTNTAE